LSLHEVSLYDGWRDSLHKAPIPGVPARLEDVLGPDAPDGRGPPHGRGEARLHHVQGGGGEDGKAEAERFFREVAKGLARHAINDAQKPVILAAQPQHQGLFRKVSSLPGLLEEGIAVDGRSTPVETLRDEARRILRPVFERRVAQAREEFALALSKGQASANLGDIARAVAQGRVRRLCVESGRRFWGMLDRRSGDVVPGEPRKNAYDVDIYDELAELTLVQEGEVLVLEKPEMPTRTGIAAVYRY
jgi:hypothetical protein